MWKVQKREIVLEEETVSAGLDVSMNIPDRRVYLNVCSENLYKYKLIRNENMSFLNLKLLAASKLSTGDSKTIHVRRNLKVSK
jgi:hypothetical protein